MWYFSLITFDYERNNIAYEVSASSEMFYGQNKTINSSQGRAWSECCGWAVNHLWKKLQELSQKNELEQAP